MLLPHSCYATMTFWISHPYCSTEVNDAMSTRRLQIIVTPRAVTPPASFELLAVALLILLIAAAFAP